jgi:hypothetical protein
MSRSRAKVTLDQTQVGTIHDRATGRQRLSGNQGARGTDLCRAGSLGFAVGIALKDGAALGPVLAVAEPMGNLWLRALQLTILPLVIGLVVTGISQTLAAAGGGIWRGGPWACS